MNDEDLIEFHQQWLQHPVTQKLRELLRKREQQYVESIGKAAASDDSDTRLRNLGNQLRTVQADIQLAFDTTTFINKVKENKQ